MKNHSPGYNYRVKALPMKAGEKFSEKLVLLLHLRQNQFHLYYILPRQRCSTKQSTILYYEVGEQTFRGLHAAPEINSNDEVVFDCLVLCWCKLYVFSNILRKNV